eukprot:353256_1
MSWKELKAGKTGNIRPQPIQMEDCIWWSTDYDSGERGMVQYDIQSDKIISVVKYPNNIKPKWHSCCKYKNEIYIVDGQNGQIIAFNTQNNRFQIKTKMDMIGRGAQCIAMYDDVHIFGGHRNSKHLVYRIKENKIKILNDTTTTANIGYASIVKYKDQIIRFGGYNYDTDQYVDALFISSRIKRNTLNDIEWTSMPSWKCNQGVCDCGYLMYKHYIIMFGGATTGNKRLDTICVLNVRSADDGWIELNHIKCPMPSEYHAVVDTMDNIHILSGYNDKKDCKHYSISISSVLKDICTEVAAFLLSVGLAKYVDAFAAQDIETLDVLKELTDDELKEIGVTMGHKRKMKKAIAKEEQSNEVIAYGKDDDDDSKDDMKIQDDVPRVENGLVMFFGAGKYDSEIYPDLDDIIEDEECLR